MKKLGILLCLLSSFILSSSFLCCGRCDYVEYPPSVTFGANFDVINCPVTVTIFLDNENIGTLENPVEKIHSCSQQGTIFKEISPGKHSYKIEIRPKHEGGGCSKDITGTFSRGWIDDENNCEKIFIDFYKIFNDKPNDCDEDIIISQTEYENIPNDTLFHIIDMNISGDCLNIKFTASGCDGSRWVTKLIASEHVIETNPCQHQLKLILDNKESCEAMPVKEVSFNIKGLQIREANQVLLNISGKNILYEY